MEVIWISSLINKDNYERKSKSHVLCLTLWRSLYHISLLGHLFFKCDEMGLSCFFLSHSSSYGPMWRGGNEMVQPVGGPGLNSGQKLVFFLSSFLVFPFHVVVF